MVVTGQLGGGGMVHHSLWPPQADSWSPFNFGGISPVNLSRREAAVVVDEEVVVAVTKARRVALSTNKAGGGATKVRRWSDNAPLQTQQVHSGQVPTSHSQEVDGCYSTLLLPSVSCNN